MASLYERFGGLESITSVVDSFVARCANDDRINRKFERSDVPRLKKMLVDQVCEATGGPCTYTGRDMRPTHDGMAVTAGEFDALVEDLVLTLGEFDVPRAEQQARFTRSDARRHRRGGVAGNGYAPASDLRDRSRTALIPLFE
jgi:hemoglobin